MDSSFGSTLASSIATGLIVAGVVVLGIGILIGLGIAWII